MSHIKTIDFAKPKTQSGKPTSLKIEYEAETEGESITLESLVTGVTVAPPSVHARKGAHTQAFEVTLTRGAFPGTNVLIQATIMIDPDHGSSAFDSIELI